jgi:hypothetical protein
MHADEPGVDGRGSASRPIYNEWMALASIPEGEVKIGGAISRDQFVGYIVQPGSDRRMGRGDYAARSSRHRHAS